MKKFFDVFPSLKVNDELKSLFCAASVVSIAKVKAGSFLRIKIDSPNQITEEDFAKMEAQIFTQVLSSQMRVKIEYESGYEFAAAPLSSPDAAKPAPAPAKTGNAAAKAAQQTNGKGKYKRKKKETEEGMIYGRAFEGSLTPISDIVTDMKSVCVQGEIFAVEQDKTKNGTQYIKIFITDYEDSIFAMKYLAEGEEDLPGKLKKGQVIIIKGNVEFNNFEGDYCISRVEAIKPSDFCYFTRCDTCKEGRRAELHLHTRMSEMDALTDVEKAIERAVSWGHKAMAITDHGVVQAFPAAFHKLQDMKKAAEKKGEELDFKIIYGCEGYIVDDSDDPVIKNPDDEVELIKDEEAASSETIKKIKKKKTHHIILLAKNETGRVNLYRLVSFSHINYFSRRPRIPRSVLERYREGIIVGSACVMGELMDAVLSGASDEELERIASFYDYLEIQPIDNNAFLIRNYEKNAKGHKVKDKEGLKDLNRKVTAIGDKLGKMVAATGDVHFLDPKDEIFRTVIMDSQNFDDAKEQAPLYLKTTDEMLEEFSYLGAEKAREVVIENTNRIAGMIDYIEPVRPDKCPPVIENSEKRLTDTVYANAYRLYGNPLPDIVCARIEKELDSIIGNGYAVLYIIAMELVQKSVSDGYLVGSRGSVGSSFVATMSGITEVNPLKPHYRCPKCLYSDFDSEEVNKYAGGAGCDMPDRACPVCGEPLIKDGFDIPFETFLGFKGDKEPDIDLNFSGEYQARAHAYTEELFGQGHTFRAGTLSALQDKTVYGFVKKYAEKNGLQLRKAEINRLVAGCTGVKRSTGQHPGGIVVLPHGEEIYSFTPVQHPANDASKGIITTHFDYHSIDHNLLKLDELGHDDPTMIKMLEDLTGTNARDIKLDDPDVMKLFSGCEVLGIKPEDIGGYKLGTLGVPEFGTDFVMQMLEDTKPKNYSDLVRIAGLSHGTDVWTSNAEVLVKEGRATLSTCICTRDDIMTYLMLKGLEPSMAFDIMEAVRKGKVARGGAKDKWPEWEAAMKAHDVPDWYLWSCTKIQYMFPKAHAVAYVMMAYRIAWYKIFYPLAYYAAFFSIRASSFNYELMCMGKEELLRQMDIIKGRIERRQATPKDEDYLKYMYNVLEMHARGFEFMPIDIYRAKANRFQIIDGKLMPSFMTIDGMGDKAAFALEEEAAKEKFTSREDLKIRTKLSSTLTDKLYTLGLLGAMPESSQMSFADLFGL